LGALALNRRRVLAAGAATLLGAAVARSQPKPAVATVIIADPMPAKARGFVSRMLADSGFVEGQNLRLEQRELLHSPPELAETRARQVIAARPECVFMAFGAENRPAPAPHARNTDHLPRLQLRSGARRNHPERGASRRKPDRHLS
jgi:hypothetical protein